MPSLPSVPIDARILLLRGQRVMLDADLAQLYGVATKRLKEQVKRNRDRLPPGFMFQLTHDEKAEVVASCDHLRSLKFSPSLPTFKIVFDAIRALMTPPDKPARRIGFQADQKR